MAEQTAETADAHLWRNETRSLVSGVNLVVLIAAIAAGVFGVFDSMTDADGDRFWGNLVVAAPGIYAGWCMLEIAWKRLASIATVMLRLVSACFFAPAFVAAPIAVIQTIAIAFPGVRDAIAEAQARNGGFHYYWDEGIGQQLFLVPLGGYAIGMCIPLGVALIVTLPIISIRAPHIAAQGSHLEKVDGARRISTTGFVFVGLGATTLGIVLWVFGDGGSILEFPDGVARFLNALSYGYADWDDVMWLLGVLCVVAGVGLMGWGCVRVLFARGRAAQG
ncbi:hypothetical protein [Microbacterium aerolatum]|uniref:Uncharacterized protein n=1 Tax=Microbacterium aerolatum TaxID=153731 RepID=A0A511AH22_9MICO|nr:hypothetical protein [Microbacterium aerolatum]GEK85277.1 hypothetical protein MAE01_04530 [Microbacterium aerolatum]GGB29854.1 hypothetical protein GCM10007198_20340 [Microbacterium aerolatum]